MVRGVLCCLHSDEKLEVRSEELPLLRGLLLLPRRRLPDRHLSALWQRRLRRQPVRGLRLAELVRRPHCSHGATSAAGTPPSDARSAGLSALRLHRPAAPLPRAGRDEPAIGGLVERPAGAGTSRHRREPNQPWGVPVRLPGFDDQCSSCGRRWCPATSLSSRSRYGRAARTAASGAGVEPIGRRPVLRLGQRLLPLIAVPRADGRIRPRSAVARGLCTNEFYYSTERSSRPADSTPSGATTLSVVPADVSGSCSPSTARVRHTPH